MNDSQKKLTSFDDSTNQPDSMFASLKDFPGLQADSAKLVQAPGNAPVIVWCQREHDGSYSMSDDLFKQFTGHPLVRDETMLFVVRADAASPEVDVFKMRQFSLEEAYRSEPRPEYGIPCSQRTVPRSRSYDEYDRFSSTVEQALLDMPEDLLNRRLLSKIR